MTRRSRDNSNGVGAGRQSSGNIRNTGPCMEEVREEETDTMTVTRLWKQPDTSQSAIQEHLGVHSVAEWDTDCWKKETPD